MTAKRFFSLFVGIILFPLVAAYLVLKLQWFQPAATNKGQFLTQEITLDLESDEPHWAVIYQPPQDKCTRVCEELLYGLHQTYQALGKLQVRVSALVLQEQEKANNNNGLLTLNRTDANLSANYIYVVDPLGKVILKYPGSETRAQTITMSKAILADLKKLLNYSRVG